MSTSVYMLQTQFRFATHKMYHSLDAAKPSLEAIEIGGMFNVTRCISREMHAPRISGARDAFPLTTGNRQFYNLIESENHPAATVATAAAVTNKQ